MSAETRRMVSLPTETVAWFEETYQGASLSWALGLLLEEFKRVHSLTPVDYAALGAAALKRKIEET